jgi:ubiquinone/menaquinone biosynthesis C-methylase UbiE
VAATVGLPPGVARALALLEPGLRNAEPRLRDGYLDLVGDRSPRSTGPAQDLMLTGIVPAIYERWWRPALGRIAKGVFGPGMAEERRIARLLLGLGPGDGVLDVACGPGNFTREFARAVGDAGLAVGIDASPTMLARAVRDTGAADVAYVRGDAVALPFRDESFDAVCCFAALHLFADPFTALDHMTRVLTTGGRIAVFTSCRTRAAPPRPLDRLATTRCGLRMFDRDEITDALRARGFSEIRRRITGLTQFVGGRLG